MHILYIYREYMNRRKKYGDEMVNLGHNVTFMCLKDKKTMNQISKKTIMKYEPDLVWLLSPFFIQNNVVSKDAVDYIKQKSIPLVCYAPFNTQVPYIKQNDVWEAFDFYFAQQKDFYNYLKKIGINTYYIPLAFYHDQYKPMKQSKNIQVSFAGNPQTTVDVKNDKRVAYLKSLAEFNLKVYGKGFIKRGISATVYSTHVQQNKLYVQSEINLDLPFINSSLEFYKKQYYLKNRFFEVPATNSFLLTAKCEEFIEILDETMVGYFDGSAESMLEMVSKYLKDKDEREKMAKKAYKEVINNHTFSHRFKKMFDIIGEI